MGATQAVAAFKSNLTRAESAAVTEAIASGWAGSGIYVRLFERRLSAAVGVPHVLAANSGTAALHLALRVFDIAGGEIITTPLTSPATNHAILYNRAVPVFCDVDKQSGCIDPARAAKLVTRRTRAIMAVHFNGHPCDMAPLLALAKKRGLAVVEDAGGAFPQGGSYRGRPLGSMGDIGCFSFSRKNFTTLDGGAAVCRRPFLARRMERLRNLGQVEGGVSGDRGRELEELGFPYRMNDVAAAMGLAQFTRWKAVAARLARIERRYRRGLSSVAGVTLPVEKSFAQRSLSCFALRAPGIKTGLRGFLRAHGIQTDDWLHPNHLFPLYKPYRRRLPIAERLAAELLYLPFYPGLKDREVGEVVKAVRAFRR